MYIESNIVTKVNEIMSLILILISYYPKIYPTLITADRFQLSPSLSVRHLHTLADLTYHTQVARFLMSGFEVPTHQFCAVLLW